MKTALRMIGGAYLLLAVTVFIAARAEAQAIASYSGTAVANEIDVDLDGVTGNTATFQGRGQFGNFVVQAHVEHTAWDGMSLCDPSSALLYTTVWSGALTYANGDQLYLELSDGVLCAKADGSYTEEVNLNITGGTGRFEGATGSIVGSTSGQALLSEPGRNRTAIGAFGGTFSQDIVFPN